MATLYQCSSSFLVLALSFGTAVPASKTSLIQVSALTGKANATAEKSLNVLGTALKTCSSDGEALTGFTRDGFCREAGDDDAGSHHVCIKMKSDFCTVTGQDNWCAENMECMGKSGECPIVHWCVCQWAFAAYITKAGGCDSIVDLKCEAVNMAAFKAYEKSSDQEHKTALACIKKKCNIS
eukprot:TRINITY_DN35629_c0_g1_i1.p1 TRINITY_DN35629_c0_g1~~TRINITY_DN35629_c0_g1_i1.p1  ORF type:complete len:181 (-),score=26.43 TRINITY_DN35629_c0_g1_i1:224-766(-)